jgi:hypothetical protein
MIIVHLDDTEWQHLQSGTGPVAESCTDCAVGCKVCVVVFEMVAGI